MSPAGIMVMVSSVNRPTGDIARRLKKDLAGGRHCVWRLNHPRSHAFFLPQLDPLQEIDSLVSKTDLSELARRVADLRNKIQDTISQIVVGQERVTNQLLMALIASGHVLLEGVPGTAKTTLCRAFSQVLGIDYERIQFTPDLLPSDVTGTQVLDRQTSDFVLRKGPVFCQLLLADELNRAPARTQSSLLEAMQERQVTIEGRTLPLPEPFMVLATQNPIEQEGVYRLPEAQLDRFLFRVHVGYPDREQEIAMLDVHSRAQIEPEVISNAAEIIHVQQQLDSVFCAAELKSYIIDLVRRSREHSDLILGASPRAAINLMKAARAHALLHGNDYVTHVDVQEIVQPVLGHRLIIRPEAEMDGESVAGIIKQLIQSVPVLHDAGAGSRRVARKAASNTPPKIADTDPGAAQATTQPGNQP